MQKRYSGRSYCLPVAGGLRKEAIKEQFLPGLPGAPYAIEKDPDAGGVHP
jgi:hypothetical protein